MANKPSRGNRSIISCNLLFVKKKQPLAQGLPNLMVVLLDLECETAPQPLAQAHIATTVPNEAGPPSAFLLALDPGDHR